MTSKVADPYSVVLKRKKLPMGLLQDAAIMHQEGNVGSGLLTSEPFPHAFGGKSRRKKVKLEQLMVGRKSVYDEEADPDGKKKKTVGPLNYQPIVGGQAKPVEQMPESDAGGYAALMKAAQVSSNTYETVNNREGIVPWGRDSNITKTEGEGVDWRSEKKADLFLKGQSKRIWGEFYKVVDCSDVILHIIDARNVPGTRCTMIEKHIAKNASHKHLVFVLNKIDLVPNWVAKRWIGELSAVRPTIAFHASMTHAFGKGALISLLRQFGKLHSDKKQISVGVIGYPNVGKSSVINTLISKKSCKVAPIPGETKIWQYITLFRNIYLIDCPGVVVDTAGDTEEDSVLKGVVRSERLETPEDFVSPILDVVRREHIAAQYGLPKDGDGTWTDHIDLLEKIAKKAGRLLKGGDPCLRSAAIYIINDYQRGRLPHFVAPPELKEGEEDDSSPSTTTATLPGIKGVQQNLEEIGQNSKDSGEKAGNEDVVSESEDEVSDNEEAVNDSGGLVVASGDWDDDK
jgi:nuclear GTP-binding protein